MILFAWNSWMTLFDCNSWMASFDCNSWMILLDCNSWMILFACNSWMPSFDCNSWMTLFACNSWMILFDCNSWMTLFDCNSWMHGWHWTPEWLLHDEFIQQWCLGPSPVRVVSASDPEIYIRWVNHSDHGTHQGTQVSRREVHMSNNKVHNKNKSPKR